ncbi:MAG TPA: tetratricopeptide repeat protein [Rubricoccaceae bacterium]|nr:tetratricopeptide repeat protein [Rubricoccaceae bacterium]
MRLALLILLPLAGCAAFADGAAEGRRGNALLAEGDAEGAAAAFRRGIEATEGEDADPAAHAALWNNLGLALYEQESYEEAAGAFDEAVALAAEPAARARYAYHAGTALARAGTLEDAADRLRRALVARPDFPEARHNYEWVKRRLDGTPPEGDTPPEPSDFARRLKAQADALVAQRQYRDAYDLLTDGLRRDSTVAAFADYIQRLGDVVQIEEGTPAPPADSLRADSLR